MRFSFIPNKKITYIIILLVSSLFMSSCEFNSVEELVDDIVNDIVSADIEEETEEVLDENIFFEENSGPLDQSDVTYYYYSRLLGTEKELYCIIYNSLMEFEQEIPVPEHINFDIINRIFRYVMHDHPEIYWIETYDIVEINGSIRIYPYQSIQDEDIPYLDAQCDRFIADVRSVVGQGKSEYEISKIVYDYLIHNITYANDANEQNMLSAMLNKRTICTGFTKLYQYILNQFGIEAVAVTGITHRGVSHMWNMVKLDGNYYYTDLTYADTNSVDGVINYDYFNTTTEEIVKIYQFEAGQILQYCASTDANYYEQEGNVFVFVDEYALQELFESGLPVSIKCKTKDCYDDMIDHLITQKNIYEYLPNQTLSYRTNDEMLRIEFY